jgi:thiol:disulfide interchange protein DsbC
MTFPRILLASLMMFSVQACAQSAAPAPAKKPAAAPTTAGDAAIRESLTKVVPGVKISAIRPSPLAGIREVVVEGQILYVSNDGKLLFQGSIIDLNTRTNLTEISEAGERRTILAAVPAAQKISFAPAKPKYRVTVFTDIDCGYCRKLHEQITEYNKLGIAVDYLFYPRAGIGSESFQKAVNVWCAPDRKVAMTTSKAGKTLPKKNCTNFVSADFTLGQKIGVDGTPAVYAANGAQIGGYLSPADMLKALEKQNK